MRTVSFSSPLVQQIADDQFVCHVMNSEGDPSAGKSQAHAPGDPAGFCSPGIGSQNVQTLFLTPQGNIFHTASGFRGPEELAGEMRFASKLFERIQAEPASATRVIPIMHRQRLRADGIDPEMLATESSPANEVARMMGDFRNGFLANQRATNPAQRMQENVFAGKTRRALMKDYQFAVRRPMMPIDEFLENPRALVGNEVSAFASGPASGGQIGGMAQPNGSRSSSRGR